MLQDCDDHCHCIVSLVKSTFCSATGTQPEVSLLVLSFTDLLRSLQAFEIRAKLYAGHISSVYRAVDKKSGITVGLKLYKRTMLNDMERHQIAREIWLHIQLNHPSIIALYAAWKDKDYIYLVLEWAPEVSTGCVCPE